MHVLHNAASQVQPETTVAVKHRVSVNLAEEEYRELSVMANKYLVSMAWHGSVGRRFVTFWSAIGMKNCNCRWC